MKQNVRIMVVEDDLFISKNICDILVNEGYEVINNICNVNDAIEAIEQQKPNLVLIDIGLEKNDDGTEIGAYLFNNSNTPFVYVSSRTDEMTLKKAKSTKPFGYIVKPFNEVGFKITVSLVLSNHCEKEPNIIPSIAGLDNISFRVKQVIHYINKNINNSIDINELSALTKWKTHHFIRVFNKEVGMTPYQFILKSKIVKACKMIDETDGPFVNIAYDLGFQNYIGFLRAFKRAVGITPEEYKNKSIAKSIEYNS